MSHISKVLGKFAVISVAALATTATAITVDVNDAETKLSDAVAAAYAADDGPDIINLNVDAINPADGQILLDKPITINGDGNNNGAPCDILVDMTAIIAAVDLGAGGKAYLEINAAGDVNINDLRMHPNSDGAFGGAGVAVGAIRTFKPLNAEDVGNYNFANLIITGSDSENSNAFVSLETGDDLYADTTIHKWGGRDAGDATLGNHAVIQLTDAGGAGIYNTLIDHCQAGLAYSGAVNIISKSGSTDVLGGLYGHCARDGFRIEGTSVTLKGTADDRLRVVRNTNINAANSHCIEVVGASAAVPLIEYVDVAGCKSANSLVIRGGNVEVVRYFRALGKLGADPINHSLLLNTANPAGLIEHSTFHGHGGFTVGVQASVTSPVNLQNCIFTHEGDGGPNTLDHLATTGTVSYTNCALPIDGEPNESLPNPPFSGAGGPQDLSDPSIVSPVLVSPDYLLTLADYDWSASQGAGDLLNGAGNRNVLRPSNLLYATAGTGGTPLTGGAGPLLSGIDAGTWMLME